jgi:hypothetical protein
MKEKYSLWGLFNRVDEVKRHHIITSHSPPAAV